MIHRLGTGAAATFNRSFVHDEALFASYRPAPSHMTTPIVRGREAASLPVELPQHPIQEGVVTPGSVAGAEAAALSC
jgi:hypothetical protein